MGKVFKSVTSILTGGSSDIAKAQEKATKRAAEQAERSYRLQQEELNRANAKEPDIDTIRSDNASGISSTMLTGPEGIDLDDSKKKRKTLLGG